MFTKIVRQPTTSFASVHHVASLAQDGIDYASRRKIEALFEVDTSVRGSGRSYPPPCKVTGAIPGFGGKVKFLLVLGLDQGETRKVL